MAKPRPSRTALLFQGRPRYDFFQTGREGLTSFLCKREDWQRPRFVSPILVAGWSSPVAREAHNLEVTGSNPVPATDRILQVLVNHCRL